MITGMLFPINFLRIGSSPLQAFTNAVKRPILPPHYSWHVLMTPTAKGPWSLEEIHRFLSDSTVPMRLACTGNDGYPRVVSVWYAFAEQALLCVSHQKSALVKLLQRDPKVGFEVSPNAPPYHGVRGQGQASLEPLGDSELLDLLLERYLGQQESRVGNWLLSRKAEEVVIRIQPERLFTWDYRERMADVTRGQAAQ